MLRELLEEWQQHQQRLKEADRQLAAFAKTAPAAEQEARKVLETIPSVGPVTIDVVLSEVADPVRFRSLKRADSFSGMAPSVRESAGRTKEQHITKEGSRLLRWAMIQTAWRMIRCQRYCRAARRKRRLERKIGDLFEHRHLFVRHHLTAAERKTLRRYSLVSCPPNEPILTLSADRTASNESASQRILPWGTVPGPAWSEARLPFLASRAQRRKFFTQVALP